jgi:hypothetical protein
MFDGDRSCNLCGKTLSEKETVFGKSLIGYSYVFCERCFRERKDDVKRALNDEKE